MYFAQNNSLNYNMRFASSCVYYKHNYIYKKNATTRNYHFVRARIQFYMEADNFKHRMYLKVDIHKALCVLVHKKKIH